MEVWCETCMDDHIVDVDLTDDVIVQARRDGCEIRLDEEVAVVTPIIAGEPSAIVAWLQHFN